MIKNSTRYNRLVDSNPVSDVDGSDEIRFSLKATGNVSKPGSFRPVLSSYGMAIAEEVPLASCTISLDITWLVFLATDREFKSSFTNEH